MPSEHKGGVRFDYWTSNPWFANRKEDSIQVDPFKAAPATLMEDPASETDGQGIHGMIDDDFFAEADTVYDSDDYAVSEADSDTGTL